MHTKHPKRNRTLLITLLLIPLLYFTLHPLLSGSPTTFEDYDTLHFQKSRYLFQSTFLYTKKGNNFYKTTQEIFPGYYDTDIRIKQKYRPNFIRLKNRTQYWILEAYTSAAPLSDAGQTLRIGGERVDRWYALGPKYTPKDLEKIPMRYCRIRQVSMRQKAARAFVRLSRAAKREGVNIYAFSGFRPFSMQKRLYLRRITIGKKLKQRAVARPGHSEHQLGTTVDVVGDNVRLAATIAFGRTRAARWLRKRCYDFGFVLSYGPDNKVPSGYMIETWHIRYIGPANIKKWKATHLK